mgnify:FL=1
MILIGSRAMSFNLGREYRKNILDWDFIATQNEYEEFKSLLGDKLIFEKDSKFGKTMIVNGLGPVEIEIVEKSGSQEIYDYNQFQNFTRDKKINEIVGETYTFNVATPDVMFLLKMSHRYLKNSPHFLKTMRDIQFLRTTFVVKIPERLKSTYKARQNFTYDYALPTLNKKKVDFFENNQEGYKTQDYMVYDHDSIHEVVKLYEKPAYDFIKYDSEDVLCSKELFERLPLDLKLATVYEEACVLALERHQIPNNFRPDPDTSFKMALEKVCTSIASGWWRGWAWKHYDMVLEFYDVSPVFYVKACKDAIEDGTLKKWDEVKNEILEVA